MNTVFPRAVSSKNSKAGVIGLSSPCNPSMWQDGLSVLSGYGFGLEIPFDPTIAYEKTVHLFSAGTPEQRLAGLKTLIDNSQVDCIFCARGGYGLVEIIEKINLEAIANWAKPLIGISDATVFLNLLTQRTGLVTFHGPVISGGFAKAKTEVSHKQNTDSLIGLLRGQVSNPFKGLELKLITENANEAEGKLCGGNLTSLVSALGTPYQLDFSKRIVIIEDAGEEHFRIHRMLMQLKHAGVFKQAAAVIMGDFFNCGRPGKDRLSIEEVFLDVLRDQKIPLFAGLPVGHGDKNLPFPIGLRARVKDKSLEFLEQAVLV